MLTHIKKSKGGNLMKNIAITLMGLGIGLAAHAADPSTVDAKCQALYANTAAENNCYVAAINDLLQGGPVPDSIKAYCASEEGGACDELNGYANQECMNACAYHELAKSL